MGKREDHFLEIDGVRVLGEYKCSESALATVKKFFENELPDQEEFEVCYSFETLGRCLPDFEYDSLSVEELESQIEAGNPVIVSTIPDEQDELHSVVVAGFNDEIFEVISDGERLELGREEFEMAWGRTGNNSLTRGN